MVKKKYKRSKGVMQEMPSRDFIYGPEGVGKTSLANTYPNPTFLDFEGSTSDIDADRIVVNNWDSFSAVIYDITKTDEFKDTLTVVFDTMDWFEKVCMRKLLEDDGAKTITDAKLYGYGKGDARIDEFWHSMIYPILRSILASGKNIVIVAHSEIKAIDDPLNGRYDTYQIKSGKKFGAFFKEWCSNLYFMNYDLKIVQGASKFDKKKAVGSNARYVYTQRTPQYSAKSRYPVGQKLLFKEGHNPYQEHIKIKEPSEDKLKLRAKDALAELSKATDFHDVSMIDSAFQDIADSNAEYISARELILERFSNEQEISEG